jgi:hypothetical protein
VSAVDGDARPGRALAFSVAAVLLAAVAHSAAGGQVPPVSGVLAAGACCWLLGLLLAGRRWGPLGLVGLLGGTQLVLHEVFHRLAAAPVPTHDMSSMDMSSMDMSSMDMASMPGMAMPAPTAPGTLLDHSSLLMLTAHVLAVLAAAAVLAAGEAAHALARRLRCWSGRLPAAVVVPVVVRPWRLVPPARPRWVVRLVGPERRLTRRGPPARPAPGVPVVVAAVSW